MNVDGNRWWNDSGEKTTFVSELNEVEGTKHTLLGVLW